jgi:hypothetical protein
MVETTLQWGLSTAKALDLGLVARLVVVIVAVGCLSSIQVLPPVLPSSLLDTLIKYTLHVQTLLDHLHTITISHKCVNLPVNGSVFQSCWLWFYRPPLMASPGSVAIIGFMNP